jgi:hypothetical protein
MDRKRQVRLSHLLVEGAERVIFDTIDDFRADRVLKNISNRVREMSRRPNQCPPIAATAKVPGFFEQLIVFQGHPHSNVLHRPIEVPLRRRKHQMVMIRHQDECMDPDSVKNGRFPEGLAKDSPDLMNVDRKPFLTICLVDDVIRNLVRTDQSAPGHVDFPFSCSARRFLAAEIDGLLKDSCQTLLGES